MTETKLSEKRPVISATRRLAESGIMIAVSIVLSVIPLLELPYGGSITACACLPLLILAYRYGILWGMFSGVVYGLVQMFLGMKNVLFFTTPLSIIAVILLDYLVAFAVMGLAGAFRKSVPDERKSLLLGTVLAGLARYACHVISGCTIWAGLSIPTTDALLYSLAYNATYMLPETVILLLGVAYTTQFLDFGSVDLRRRKAETHFSGSALALSLISKAFLLVAAVWDVLLVFGQLQNAETGDFDITGIAQVNWLVFALVSAAGIVLWLVLTLIAKKLAAKKAA